MYVTLTLNVQELKLMGDGIGSVLIMSGVDRRRWSEDLLSDVYLFVKGVGSSVSAFSSRIGQARGI